MELEFKTQAKIRSQENLIRSIPQPGLQELSLETISGTLKRKAVTGYCNPRASICAPSLAQFFWGFSIPSHHGHFLDSCFRRKIQKIGVAARLPVDGVLKSADYGCRDFPWCGVGSKQPFPGIPVIPQ